MVVTVAQLLPTSVRSPTTWPFSVTAHMPTASPAFSPLAMVKELRQVEASQEMM